MKQIIVRQDNSVYKMTEDGEFYCAHIEVRIDKACCSGRDSDGLIACGCNGQDNIVCENENCTGIEDWEVEELFTREGL